MTEPTPPDPAVPPAPTRRGLLKTLAALGALGATGLTTAAPRPAATTPLRVAVIVPRASRYPGLSAQFRRGLDAATASHPMHLQAHVTGPLPHEARATVNAALEGGAQALILLGDGLAAAARDVLAARPVPVLAAELGARLPDAHATPAPLTVTLTLRAWEAEWAHGAHLARSRVGPLHLLISRLDSGYDLPYAFSVGLTGAGGTLTGTTIFDEAHPDPVALNAAIRAAGARAVHVQCSGGAHALTAALARAGLKVSVGGLSSPGRPAFPSALGGAPSRLTPAAQARLGAGRPDPLAALGYDAGTWLTTALAQLRATHRTPLALHAALAHTAFTGTRGTLQPDGHGQVRAPLLLSRPGQADLALTSPETARTEFRLGELRSGFIHTFLHA